MTKARNIAEFADDLSVSNGEVSIADLKPSQSMMFRNRIINGDMRIDQRNAGSSVTPADSQYTLDRYIYYATQGSKFTVEQKEGLDTTASNYEANSTPDGFKNSLKLTATAYALQPGDYFLINQRIEGLNVLDFNFGTSSAKTLTLSFYVKSTGLTYPVTLGGAISNGAFDRSYPFEYQVQSSNTWERITITITGDTSGTWLKTNGTGLIITFSLGVGSSKQGTANTWGSQAFSTSNEEPIVETNGATLYITGVQLEEGTVATPFEHRPYGMELGLAKRYFEKSEKSYRVDRALSSSSTYGISFFYEVEKRATPLVITTAQGGTTGQARANGTPFNVTQDTGAATTRFFSIYFNSVLSVTSGNAVTTDCSWSADAEL